LASSGDDVAAADTELVRGRALEQLLHRDVAIDGHDGDAEPVVASLLALAQLSILAWIHEARMRIERLEHPADGAVHEAVGLDRLDVPGFDFPERGGERPVLLRQAFLVGDGAASEDASGDGRRRDRERGKPEIPRDPHAAS
jgi:hypothetical protein